jgi:hypothetical protein
VELGRSALGDIATRLVTPVGGDAAWSASELGRRASSEYDVPVVVGDLLAETKEPAVSAESSNDPIVPLLIDELHGLLTREDLVEGANLHLARQDDRLVIQIMAVTTGTLGVVLASLSDPPSWATPAASRAGSRPVRCAGDPASGNMSWSSADTPSITASCSWPRSGYPSAICLRWSRACAETRNQVRIF